MEKVQECLYRNSNECTGAQKEEVSELDQYRKLEKDRGEEEVKRKIDDARSERLKNKARNEYR